MDKIVKKCALSFATLLIAACLLVWIWFNPEIASHWSWRVLYMSFALIGMTFVNGIIWSGW